MQQKQTNRDSLVPIIETILFLGRQELAFHGHRGESAKLNTAEPKENDGNFRAALRLRLRAGDSVSEWTMGHWVMGHGSHGPHKSMVHGSQSLDPVTYILIYNI